MIELVDECHLLISPVLIGGGKPSLPSHMRAELELLDERRFSNACTSATAPSSADLEARSAHPVDGGLHEGSADDRRTTNGWDRSPSLPWRVFSSQRRDASGAMVSAVHRSDALFGSAIQATFSGHPPLPDREARAMPDSFLLCEELDIATAPETEAQLRRHVQENCDGDVIVDCGDCTFMGSTALSVFARMADEIAPRRLILRDLRAAPRRLLDITDMTKYVYVEELQDS